MLVLVSVSYAGNFTIVGDSYYLNGKPHQIHSAEFQYYRVHPSRWEDTFKKIANAGLNGVQTYIAWNIHEPRKGEFHFDGFGDIDRYFSLAQKYNLTVTLRPGPFICDEWEFGGLPYWLLKEDGIQIRTTDPRYFNHVRDWFNVLFPILKPHMIQNGGNIIMTQIENEYGSYFACQKEYLEALYDITVEHLGEPTNYIVFTTDGPTDYMMKCGRLEGKTHTTVDFHPGEENQGFGLLRKYMPVGPLQNTEFYNGWIDHWEEKHSKGDKDNLVKSMEIIHNMGGSFNLYVFVGGTNWGFYSGANRDKENEFKPQVTSYDFDGPLSDIGYMTPKYYAVRDMMSKWVKLPHYEIDNYPVANYGELQFVEMASLWDNLDVLDPEPVFADKPMTFEHLDLDFGFVLYRTKVSGSGTIRFDVIHDRAYIYVKRQFFGSIGRLTLEEVAFTAEEGDYLDIVVESQGRVNHGTWTTDPKGIIGDVFIDGAAQTGFEMYRLGMKDVSGLRWRKAEVGESVAFYRAVKKIDSVADTFINPTGWTKGHIYVNQFNIGRYWNVGPQLTLYCPAPLLKEGKNEFIAFEISKNDRLTMTLDDKHQIDINYPCLFYSLICKNKHNSLQTSR